MGGTFRQDGRRSPQDRQGNRPRIGHVPPVAVAEKGIGEDARRAEADMQGPAGQNRGDQVTAMIDGCRVVGRGYAETSRDSAIKTTVRPRRGFQHCRQFRPIQHFPPAAPTASRLRLHAPGKKRSSGRFQGAPHLGNNRRGEGDVQPGDGPGAGKIPGPPPTSFAAGRIADGARSSPRSLFGV